MTPPTNDGKNKSENTPEKKLEALETILDEYDKKLGLGLTASDEVVKYMDMGIEELRKMSPEECGEAAFILSKEAAYIQKEINKHKTRFDWANFHIDREVANQLSQYDNSMSWGQKRTLAIRGNDYANKLHILMARAQHCINRLSYLPGQIRYMSETLIEYQKSKTYGA
jgi:hypothetical protein